MGKFRHRLNRLLNPFGYQVLKAREAELLYQHNYAGGYKEYRAAQTRRNKALCQDNTEIWADGTSLTAIATDLRAHGLGRNGICHGARNGFEVAWFREHLGGEVIGTDISDTATQFLHMNVWDFHDDNPEWIGQFDFIYTNALDHAFEPERAMKVWAKQIKPKGRIYIEHTMCHAPPFANEADPFGAHPMIMPYLLFEWGRGEDFHLVDILKIKAKANMDLKAWIFVLSRNHPDAQAGEYPPV